MKICILGAGALGCAMGGVLAEAGNDVWLVNRNADQVAAINTRGLRLRSADANGVLTDRTVKVQASTTAEAAGVVDLVVLLVKSFHTADAMSSALSLLGPGTVVMSLQNGLGHEDVLSSIVGRNRVLAGKTYAGGTQMGLGHVLVGTRGKDTHIGELMSELDGSITPRAQRIANVFNQAGLQTSISANIMGTIWDKLLINVATGALTGITRLTYGELYKQPLLEACGVAAVAEAMAVARACGVTLSITEPMQAWRKAGAGLPDDFKTSMLQSLASGRVTEIDFVNGAVVERGALYGVPTPVNQALVACIKALESKLLPKS